MKIFKIRYFVYIYDVTRNIDAFVVTDDSSVENSLFKINISDKCIANVFCFIVFSDNSLVICDIRPVLQIKAVVNLMTHHVKLLFNLFN